MASTTRKRGGLGGGGKRGGGGGGGRKNPTKTRKTTTTTFTTTTTKDAEKKKPCVDFLSLFFFLFLGGRRQKQKELCDESVCARDPGVVRVSKSSGGATKDVRLSRRKCRVVLFLRAPARSDSFFRSLSHSHNFPTFFLSLSLSQRAREADYSGVLYASSSGRF